jgi:hypothetical protein
MSKLYFYELSGSCGATKISVTVYPNDVCTVHLYSNWMGGHSTEDLSFSGKVVDRTGNRLVMELADAAAELYFLDQPYRFSSHTEEMACMVMAQDGTANKGYRYDTLFVLHSPVLDKRWNNIVFRLTSDSVPAGPNWDPSIAT